MDQKEGNLLFGEEYGEAFRLNIRVDVQGHRHLMLFRGEVAVPGVFKPTLALLQYMAERPKEELLEVEIARDIGEDNIEKYVSLLRGHLGDSSLQPKFVQTIPTKGYKFLVDVRREGDLGVDVFPRWRNSKFFELLRGVKRGKEESSEDLRIVTTGFSCGVHDLELDEMLSRGARVMIVMMNPRNPLLLAARLGLRRDGMDSAKGKRTIEEQILDLGIVKRRATSSKLRGRLQVKVSNALPSVIIHTDRGALMGVFPSQESYVKGPMIEIQHGTDLWKLLHEDWRARWEGGIPVDLDTDTIPDA